MPGILPTAALALFTSFVGSDGAGRYVVSWVRDDPPRLRVEASLPIEGRELSMDTTRPGLIPELDAGGWPALVVGLSARDGRGSELALERAGDGGWRLAQEPSGRIELAYEVDYAPLADMDWPAPREACWLEEGFFSLVGRSLFVTTGALEQSSVRFVLPDGWRAVTPWTAEGVPAPQFLTENLLIFSRGSPEQVEAGGLRVLVVPTRRWDGARAQVRGVLQGAIPRLVEFMGSSPGGDYVVALLPQTERGGESFRSSFALNFDGEPGAANRAIWGNTIAHEVFHHWNGWGLRGADYASSQWFQEGFTEYAANVALVAAGITTEAEFLGTLAEHVRKRAQLATALENTGGRKGPPLYSAGALVAFDWDVRIRHATAGEKSLWDVLRALWVRTGGGARPYEWADLEAALAGTVEFDWNGYRRDFLTGGERLPLEETFEMAGVRLREGEPPRLEVDRGALPAARELWRDLIGGR
jgi:predicted metalloprotease with PDZ domain